MLLRQFGILALILSLSVSASASGKYRDPTPDKTLIGLSSAPHQGTLDNDMRLLVWNVFKTNRGMAWAKDFLYLADRSDLVLLQEGMHSDFATPIMRQATDYGWWMAVAYIRTTDRAQAGVITGAKVNPFLLDYTRAAGREPASQTGKVTLSSKYKLTSGSTLLVINIHGINFVRNKVWRKQIDQLEGMLKNHKGPSIVAGDFNTWNAGRTKYLNNMLARYSYSHVKFPNDRRLLKLDHVYMRGCTSREPEILKDIRSSDHQPLYVKVNCE